jgi:hypothetical protein
MATKGMILVLLVFSIIMLSVPAQAAITITYNAGTTYETTALTGFSTHGDDMVGMRVTAFYVGGGSDTAEWEATGTDAGEALGTDWVLSESGDTFSSTWSFTSIYAISKLLIEAGPGNTVFDTQHYGDVTGTPGSERGWTFEYLGGMGPASDVNLDISYFNQVALTGDAAVGDLYLNLSIEFLDGFSGVANAFTFRQDTDNLLYSGDITPVAEPSMMALFFSGLAGLAGFGWRFRK